MGKKKVDVKLVYLLLLVIAILIAIIINNMLTNNIIGKQPAVTSEEQASIVQEDVGTSVSDIKNDLEQLKKSLGK